MVLFSSFFLWTLASNINLITPMAYLPFSSLPANKETQSYWEIGTARQQRLDSSRSTALQHSLCFHYRTASWEPDEINDGAMDYPAWTGRRD